MNLNWNKIISISLSGLFFLIFLTTSRNAKTHIFKEKKIEIYLPEHFEVVENDVNSINVKSKEKFARLTMTFIPSKSTFSAVSNLGKMLSKIIENPEPTDKPSSVKINELSMILFEGKGKYQKKDILFKGSLIQTSPKDVGFLLIIADDETTKLYMKDFLKILNSIRAIK